MSCFKEKTMFKRLSGISGMFICSHDNDPFVRIAEVEYNREFRSFVKLHGRRPNKEEAMAIMGR